jgi:two-component system chemotaxis sensor kinase CheA
MIEQNEILREFLIESNESLDVLDRELLALERSGATPDRLNLIFRTVHTIKGTAGFLNLVKLEKVTHVGESLLDSLRSDKITLSPEISVVLFKLLDAMRKILSSMGALGTEGEDPFDELIDELKQLNTQTTLKTPPTVLSEEETLEQLFEQSRQAYLASGSDSQLSQVHSSHNQELPMSFTPSLSDQDQITRQDSSDKERAGIGSTNSASKTSIAESSLRVDVNLLDDLMNLVGELVLSRNQILQHSRNQKDQTILNASQRLNLITTELQEGVMKTRMQQISNVWSKFPRVVRDLAKQLNKQVRLEMEGKETELDKTIIEAIKDPLTHIIRNSVDHGIEAPDVRQKAGKDPEGVVTLRAFHEGGQVIIEIADDGAGLKIERIKQKALEKGIVSAEQLRQWSTQEIQRIIFMAGFSTADAVTNVSGRGVGMDVVRSNIERIGGQVEISSVEGKGSTLRIKIPLTLAIIPALIVSCGQEQFAIPQVVLLELVRVDKDSRALVERIGESYFYRLRGDLLPLVSLACQLELQGARNPFEEDTEFIFIVVKADDQTFGIVVDEVHDTEEIVVKPLGKQLKNLTVFAGATVMGDGSVALILDALGLARRAGISESMRSRTNEGQVSLSQGDHSSLLIVRIDDNYQVAFPLDAVHRLEEFEPKAIEYSGGRPVIQYRTGILPLIDLSQFFCGKNLEQDGEVQVVVYADGADLVGFLVSRIEDIVEQAVTVHGKQRRKGTRGSIIVRDRITELLNPDEIVNANNASI